MFRKTVVEWACCYQNDQLVREIKVCVQARDSKCWDCDYDVQDISRYQMRGSICQISAHCTTPRLLLAVRRFKSPGLSKNDISSLLLLLPDLIWSLEIISNALTLLSKYVNIIANYFLAPCTFYFRLKIEFVFRDQKSILCLFTVVHHTGIIGWSRGSKWMMASRNVGRFAENKP